MVFSLACSSQSPEVHATPQTEDPQTRQTITQATRNNPNRLYQLHELETVEIKIGEHKIKVWVMDTYAKRMEGMMFLRDAEVKDDEGMLFVFAGEDLLSFWMKNTYIPLDIAYINRSKEIVSTHTMRPHDETGVPALRPAMYALEMKQGAFRRLGIRPGMKVEIPDSVKSKDLQQNE